MKYGSLISKIQGLSKGGIVRDPNSFSFITQYPPPLTLNKISNFKFKRRAIELYIHIPFCTGKCAYCKFFSFCVKDKKVIQNYLGNLEKELKIYLKKSDLKDRVIDSIYLGGGTPSILRIDQIKWLMRLIRKNLRVSKNVEITIESSPETLTAKKLFSYLEYGINRISIGVQDFNDDILRFVMRRHTGKMAIEEIEKARKAGFKKINIDLIYGLPRQTINHWKNNLSIISKLRPEYITIYHLRREKGTVIATLKKSEFPSKEEIIKMYLEGLNRLKELGYIQIAPDQFASPGNIFEQQENKWKVGKELIGLGASGYSFFNGFVYYNARSIKDYSKLVQEGKLPVWLGKEVSAKELMRRTLIFGLKTSGINREDSGLDKKMFEERFGITVESFFGVELERLRKLGLIKDDGNFIKLSLTGLVLSEEVCRELYSPEIKTQLDKIGDKFGRGGL